MKIFAAIALAALVTTPALATAAKHPLTPYEKACAAEPLDLRAPLLAKCAAQLKDCEAGIIEQSNKEELAAMKNPPLESCREQLFEDAGGENQ